MSASRLKPAFFLGLLIALLAVTLQVVQGEEELEPVPSEDLCRPYIEKALKHFGTGSLEQTSAEIDADEEGGVSPEEDSQPPEQKEDESTSQQVDEAKSDEAGVEPVEQSAEGAGDQETQGNQGSQGSQESQESQESHENLETTTQASTEEAQGSPEEGAESTEPQQGERNGSEEEEAKSAESEEVAEERGQASEEKTQDGEDSGEAKVEAEKSEEDLKVDDEKSAEEATDIESDEGKASDEDGKSNEEKYEAAEEQSSKEEKEEQEGGTSVEGADSKQDEAESGERPEEHPESAESAEAEPMREEEADSQEADSKAEGSREEEAAASAESRQEEASAQVEEGAEGEESREVKSREKRETDAEATEEEAGSQEAGDGAAKGEGEEEEEEPTPEEELIQEIEVPENLRPRDHINQLLKLDKENEEKERGIEKVANIILKDLKKVYDNAIKPLETLYKYRDLSNRHFGDPEIFSKPLVLFMGPWSGGKSSIINYLLDLEYKQTSLRTGAEPSPAYFNILMHGEEEEILDGTQLAADWTFSGLQKFGQGLLDRLRGLRLKSKLLEKVNIVEIPGILEIRKQVQRLFPFNDACQWFIDRADIIFLVYDPSKLDVGPETEAILDQLKGREYQTRIILNKADQVKPEELMRVQGALIWSISPLMSSAEPPIMYSTSLWSLPYEIGAPTRLLYAQERAFLRDLRSAIDKRVEHKIASARRFAVRVRNHAKMVDCYLTTYYNHKTFFGNKKDMSDKIIENPQDYHIYEGLSTLTNISRYDLPDPDVYRDFFRLNPLYDFPLLSSTCTYFRGCPINRLDVAIAYDLPELVGKYKKSVEVVMQEVERSSPPS